MSEQRLYLKELNQNIEQNQHINWRTVERKEKGQLFADTFLDYVNGSTKTDKEKAVEVMLHGHRTLQQQAFDFCLHYKREMAKQEFFDGRNQFSVETAKEIVSHLDSKNIGGAPLI